MYKQVQTNEGDRWDTIAQKEYGDATKSNDIRRANPDVPSYYVFPAGIYINVPIIEDNNVLPQTDNMPPWKQ